MTESQIQDAFARWLDARKIPYHRHRMDKRTSGKVGDPDFIICWMGHVLYVEVKTPTGELSLKQEERIDHIRASGNRVEICRSVEECIEAVKGILCSNPPINTHTPDTQRPPIVDDPGEKDGMFVGSLHGTPWVFQSIDENRSNVKAVRKATNTDILNLPN